MWLDALPRTPNGKIDRVALPEPGGNRNESAAGYIAPRTPTEEVLEAIWADVLEFDRVGVHDRFGDLGGHSLQATQVVARVVQKLRVEVPLRSLLQSQTIEEMAIVVTDRMAQSMDERELGSVLARLEGLSNEEATRLLAQAQDEA